MKKVNTTNREHENDKTLTDQFTRLAGLSGDAGLDKDADETLTAEHEPIRPVDEDVAPQHAIAQMGGGEQDIVVDYGDSIPGPDSDATQYRPTVWECRRLAQGWVRDIVIVDLEWVVFCQTGGCGRKLERYAWSRLAQMVELGILSIGEVNHLLFVERRRSNLKFDDGGFFGDGTIDHPKSWLDDLQIMKERNANSFEIPDEWEPFVHDAEASTDTAIVSNPTDGITSTSEEEV